MWSQINIQKAYLKVKKNMNICCKLNKAMKTMLTQITRYMTDVVVAVTVLFVKVYMVFSHKAYWSTREIAV